MTRRERLLATLRGEPVDRPAVSFYELNGLYQDPDDADPFNIYSHPSWRPLLDLTREKTDLIVSRGLDYFSARANPIDSIAETKSHVHGRTRLITRNIRLADRTLTSRLRRDADVNTYWTVEHLLKDVEDLKAFLKTPLPSWQGPVDTAAVTQAENTLGDAGIVMIGTPDPLCLAAEMFDMAEYTVVAMTEQALFHQLCERLASVLLPQIEAIARALPGRLWRIFGPEYASPPYLPPALFREYACRYDRPMVEAIQRHAGHARIHSHGNLRAILDDIVGTGADGLDPIEPPPQGDVELSYVRAKYGQRLVLFGNLEVSDIENLPTERFAEKVKRALDEGTSGAGRGFVLMPSASPYGRELSALTLRNYEKIIELVEAF